MQGFMVCCDSMKVKEKSTPGVVDFRPPPPLAHLPSPPLEDPFHLLAPPATLSLSLSRESSSSHVLQLALSPRCAVDTER